MERFEKIVLGEQKVALRVFWRNTPLVGPEKMHVSKITGLCPLSDGPEELPGNPSAGECGQIWNGAGSPRLIQPFLSGMVRQRRIRGAGDEFPILHADFV